MSAPARDQDTHTFTSEFSSTEKKSQGNMSPTTRVVVDAEARRRVLDKLPDEPYTFSGVYPKPPLELMPKVIADLTREVAASFLVPPDMVLGFALGALSGAVGAKRNIWLQDDWPESSTIWTAVVAQPGFAKSPTLSFVVKPLREWEFGEKRKHDALVRACQEDNPENTRRAVAQVPPRRRSVVTDITVESLALKLEQNPQGLTMVRDEFLSFATAMGQYKGGKGADRSEYLSLWANTAMTVDRKKDDESIDVPYPCLAVMGGIQPDKLKELCSASEGDDGFIDRLLFINIDPAARAGKKFERPAIAEATKLAWSRALKRLLDLDMGYGRDGEPVPKSLQFEPEARELFAASFDRHCAVTMQADFPTRLLGMWSKMESYAGRFTLLIHMARWASGETDNCRFIDTESVEAAWALVRYFAAHHQISRGGIEETGEDRRVIAVMKWLKRQPGQAVRPRALISAGVAGIKSKSSALAMLETLMDRQLIQVEDGVYSIPSPKTLKLAA